jgi:hypothetical protein
MVAIRLFCFEVVEIRMNDDQKKFLMDEFFQLTLGATVQRAGVYFAGCSEEERKVFQHGLRKELNKIVESYVRPNRVDEQAHIANIVKLANVLTASHANVLQNGRFRIGTAQKALNLYLKYLWCIGEIDEPPHCPFDSVIIAKLPKHVGPSWTNMDSEDDYFALVAAAKSQAEGSSLANWELDSYNAVAQKAPSTEK